MVRVILLLRKFQEHTYKGNEALFHCFHLVREDSLLRHKSVGWKRRASQASVISAGGNKGKNGKFNLITLHL